MRLRLLLLPALLSCRGEAGDSGAGAYAIAPSEGAYLGEAEAEYPPAFDAEAVGAAVEAAVGEVLGITGAPVIELYRGLEASASDDCPQWASSGLIEYWYDSCEAEDGTVFDGYGYRYEYEAYEPGDGNTYDGTLVAGVFEITAANGGALSASGSTQLLSAVGSGGEQISYSLLDSGFAWTGDGAEGTWLAEGMDPALTWYAVRYPEVDGHAVVVSGAFQVGGRTLVFDDLLLADEALGSPCPVEPAGTISLLDEQGGWIDLVYDGPDWQDWGAAVDGCDGCATAWYRGEPLGEACSDFAPLLAWGNSPLEADAGQAPEG